MCSPSCHSGSPTHYFYCPVNSTSTAPLPELKSHWSHEQTCYSLVAVAAALWPYSHQEVDKSAACPHYCTLWPSVSNSFSLKLDSITWGWLGVVLHLIVTSILIDPGVVLRCAVSLRRWNQKLQFSQSSVIEWRHYILCDTIANGDLFPFSALRASNRQRTRRRRWRGGQ